MRSRSIVVYARVYGGICAVGVYARVCLHVRVNARCINAVYVRWLHVRVYARCLPAICMVYVCASCVPICTRAYTYYVCVHGVCTCAFARRVYARCMRVCVCTYVCMRVRGVHTGVFIFPVNWRSRWGRMPHRWSRRWVWCAPTHNNGGEERSEVRSCKQALHMDGWMYYFLVIGGGVL